MAGGKPEDGPVPLAVPVFGARPGASTASAAWRAAWMARLLALAAAMAPSSVSRNGMGRRARPLGPERPDPEAALTAACPATGPG